MCVSCGLAVVSCCDKFAFQIEFQKALLGSGGNMAGEEGFPTILLGAAPVPLATS